MKALVTGGGGFLGGGVVDALLARGDDVTSLARGDYPALRERGVTTVRGDLTDPAACAQALTGVDVVFHVAAKAGYWGADAAFRHSNVEGTRVLLDACRTAGVGKFVFTSTPSVVHTGGDIHGGDESLPYATHFDSAYPETKAEAERLVLAADGPDLATVALRPHLVWGPGDTQLVPRILARARAGRLRFVGDGSAVIDTTYVDDAVRAHLDAADHLAPGAACAGRPYFITSGDPRPVREHRQRHRRRRRARAGPRHGPAAGRRRRGGGGGVGVAGAGAGGRPRGRRGPADDAVPRPAAGHGALVRHHRRPSRPRLRAPRAARGGLRAARRRTAHRGVTGR